MKKLLLIVTVFTTLTISCKKDFITNDSQQLHALNGSIPYQEGDIVLGNRLENPYTLANMQTALNATILSGISPIKDIKIAATHLYVKFKPTNEGQYEQLASDSTIKIYDYPLDYEITQLGNRYHDPSLPDTIPTYQYAAVKANFVFNPDIAYEIIEQLYIPEEDPNIDINNGQDASFLNQLLDKAYIQTNNFDDTVKNLDRTGKIANYTPAGQIRVMDTRLNQLIGLEGVELRARRWFTTYTGRPNFSGNYTVNGSFSRPCNYSMWFTTNHYSVREHLFGLTYHIDGPKQSSNWNRDIHDGYGRFEAHIFRGAYRYHYGFIDGLQRPYRPSGNRTIYVGKDQSKDWSGVNYIVFPILKIARYNGKYEYQSDEVFSTTCHETGHTSHVIKMNAGIIQYSQVSTQLQESWAVGVEWWLTKLEYKNTRGITNYGDWNYSVGVQYPNQYGYQYWNKTSEPTYTNLSINLIDSYNELGQNFLGYGTGTTNDQVGGYTFANIENNILKHAYGLSSLATKLKANKPTGVTDTQIDLLLSNY